MENKISTTWKKIIICFIGCVFLIPACGAPTKKASDVASIFEDVDTLQDKTTSACKILKDRDESPSTKDLTFSPKCGDAGLKALNLAQIDTFYFDGLDGSPSTKDTKEEINKNIRTQVWLNRSILGLASVLGKKIASGQNIDLGKLEVQSSGGMDFSKLVKLDIQVPQKPVFNVNDLSFDMSLSVKATGIVTMDNSVVVKGRLIRESNIFLVTIKSTKDQPYENSLIKNFSGVIMFIPYAGDVYLDMNLDFTFYNIGFSGALDSQLGPLLGAGLKKGIDGFLN